MPLDPNAGPAIRRGAQVHLRNKTCIYCGTPLTAVSATEEHVIGRRFVPKGKLNGEWNLIVLACGPCNGRKAALEDDISAILLQPNGFGELVVDDPYLAQEATRKGKTTHRKTGKPVKDSRTDFSVPMPMNARCSFKFGFIGPPQLDPKRVAQLAWHHVTAFTYLTTFNQSTRMGRFATGGLCIFDQASQRDWGNVIQREFARATARWKLQCGVRTAGGYFKAVFRQHPSAVCRSFGLEWNRNLRIVGMLGDSAAVDAFAADLPEHCYRSLDTGTRYREEIPLVPEMDTLFSWADELPSAAVSSSQVE